MGVSVKIASSIHLTLNSSNSSRSSEILNQWNRSLTNPPDTKMINVKGTWITWMDNTHAHRCSGSNREKTSQCESLRQIDLSSTLLYLTARD